MIKVRLLSQSASGTHRQEKKPTNLCAPREFLQKCVRMFSMRDMRFVLCSHDLDILRAQRIMVKPKSYQREGQPRKTED